MAQRKEQYRSESGMTTTERPLSKKISSFSSHTSEDNPSLSAEDEEVDETFVALQKLLKALNRTNRSSNSSSNGSFLSNSSNSTQVVPANESSDHQRMSREEMLESRRQERDRFRRSLFAMNSNSNSYNTRRRRTCPAYYCSEEDEEEETSEPSVESTISNRFMNGSFSSLNVHVISRNRWSTEDRVTERLPIVMLPKSGHFTIPTDNAKIKVVQSDEFIDLRENLVKNLPPGSSLMHYLTPPRSTWHMQMHNFEELIC